MSSDGLLRVAIPGRLDQREELVATLLELALAPSGFDEVERDDGLELGVYTDTLGAERLRAAFPGAVVGSVAAGWEDAWREFHQPVRVGGLWVGPPWLAPAEHERPVFIDPGRAFGTGAHPTTRLCIELLVECERGSLLDVGCGSGVLAIAGSKLGFSPVVAVDVDPVAVEAAVANAAANAVAVDAFVADATVERLPRADVAVANVLLEPVEAILGALDSAVAITSGYLGSEVPAHPGWQVARHRSEHGWAAHRFQRSG